MQTTTVEKIRVVEHTDLVAITVFTEIPQIKESVVTRDSSSHLENDYAVSDARIDRKGNLYHSLDTKPQKRPQDITVPVERKDSIVYLAEEKTVEKEVEKELTWWQKFKINSFWWLVGAVALVLICIIVRIVNKFK